MQINEPGICHYVRSCLIESIHQQQHIPTQNSLRTCINPTPMTFSLELRLQSQGTSAEERAEEINLQQREREGRHTAGCMVRATVVY